MPTTFLMNDGSERASYPDATQVTHCAILGDSNSFGWDATMTPELQTYSTSDPQIVNAAAPYNVTGCLWYWNWRNHADQNLIGVGVGERNAARAYTSPGNFVTISADGGFDNGTVATGDAVGPDWSLFADSQQQYNALMDSRSIYNAPDGQYVLVTKHGASGSAVHNGNGNAASLHPNATAATPLFGNWQANFAGARSVAQNVGGGVTHEFFDCLYLVLTGADANDAAGFEDGPYSFAGNLKATIAAVAEEAGIDPARMPVVCTEPMGGPYGIDRVNQLLGPGLAEAKRVNPQVRWVSLEGLPRSGDIHFTAPGYVELGKRLARARWSIENAYIQELS